jgi:cytochrome b561
MSQRSGYDIPIYSRPARMFHWWVALFVLIQIPLGLYMMWRGDEMEGINDKGEAVKGVFNGINDGGLTENLFGAHKLLGIAILALVLGRLFYRLTRGAPASDPSVPAALTGISHLTHWLLYLLLIVVPIGGYIGTSYYGGLDVFGLHLPAVSGKDEKIAEWYFGLHGIGGKVILALVMLHVIGVLYHKVVRKDRVVERMLPKRNRAA